MPNLSLIISTILLGLAIAGIYLLLKKMLLPALAPGRSQLQLLNRLSYLEKIFWPVYIIAIGLSLIISNMVAGLALCLFVVVVLWKPINNYFLGLIYLLGNTYEVGQRIKYENRQGSIKAFNNLTVEMELEDGESLDIPYRFFVDTTIIRTSPQSGIMSHTINIPITKPCDLDKEKQRIKGMLLALPWVLPNQKIVFEHIEDKADQYVLKVIVHGIDKGHMYKVETKIRSMYGNRN